MLLNAYFHVAFIVVDLQAGHLITFDKLNQRTRLEVSVYERIVRAHGWLFDPDVGLHSD